MSAVELLDELRRSGVTLEAHGERLRYAPKTAVSASLAERMRTHKRELLAILAKSLDLPKTAGSGHQRDGPGQAIQPRRTLGSGRLADGCHSTAPQPALAAGRSMRGKPIAAGTLVGDPRHGKPEGPKWRCSRCDPSKHSERIRRLAARSAIRTRAA
jgi:hypothetical protein